MKISRCYPLSHMMGLTYTFITHGNLSKVVSFNGPAELLHSRLSHTTFEHADVVNLLLEEYDVNPTDAEAGATQWIDQMRRLGLIIDDNDKDERTFIAPAPMPAVGTPAPAARRRSIWNPFRKKR